MRREDSATDDRSVFPQQRGTEEFMRASPDLTVLGICTGSGLSHLNFALVHFGQNNPSAPLHMQVEQSGHIPVPSSVRDSLFNCLRLGRHGAKAASRIDELLGRLFSGGIKAFCRKHAIDITSIDLVGTHTEALELLRRQLSLAGMREHQLNWNRIVASETGISTVFDFAVIERDVVRSRLHPTAYVDTMLLQHPQKFRVCLNINELSTLSFIPAHSYNGAQAAMSHDCGPGSLLIDYAMRYCTSNDQSEDRDGKVASLGKVNQDIVDRFLSGHDYIRQPPSLSIATEMFGDHEAQQLIDACLYSNMSDHDTLATVTRVTAQNILNQYHRLLKLFFLPGQEVDELFFCGLGARNSSIIDYLKSQLPASVTTRPLHDIGIPGDAHEAVCYAQLALEAVLSWPTQSADVPLVPSSTHPQVETVRASVVPGTRWKELMSRVLDYSGGEDIHAPTNVCITGNLEAGVQDMNL
ncbi:ATP binding [Ascochyta rabiei]|uniref:ATP binding n=1 Tax=Didymella rabiei TaxID=5454 RepID=A0A163GZF0_DIDRA|nr:ATP binding [Ascochyta rabiei]